MIQRARRGRRVYGYCGKRRQQRCRGNSGPEDQNNIQIQGSSTQTLDSLTWCITNIKHKTYIRTIHINYRQLYMVSGRP